MGTLVWIESQILSHICCLMDSVLTWQQMKVIKISWVAVVCLRSTSSEQTEPDHAKTGLKIFAECKGQPSFNMTITTTSLSMVGWCQLSLLLVCQRHRSVDLFAHDTAHAKEADLSSAWKMFTHVLTIWKPKKIQEDWENISLKSVLESSGKIVTNTLRKKNLIWNVFFYAQVNQMTQCTKYRHTFHSHP